MAAFALIDPAADMVADGRVVALADHLYGVRGDSGTYLVALTPPEMIRPVGQSTGQAVPAYSCTCPEGRGTGRAQTACAHVRAARSLARANAPALDDPFAGLTSKDA